MTGKKQVPGFARMLNQWYARNRRDLPWRNTRNPYNIWLSEIILQQTRVDQGLGYYLRFCEQFPDVKSLADATEDQVLRTWQGLGYYSRARNMHHTARLIQSEYGGRFPQTFEGWLSLKGVGRYTAAAVASFCFSEKKAVVDGNVIRVLSRIFGLTVSPDTTPGKREFETLADSLIPADDPATFNQAIMEFGALCCTPVNPGCGSCPFSATCFAHVRDRVAEFPYRTKARPVKVVFMYYLFLKGRSDTCLHKRSESGIWKGLYEFPLIESQSELESAAVLKLFRKKYPFLRIRSFSTVSDEQNHLLSHRRLKARFFTAEGSTEKKSLPPGFFAVLIQELDHYPLPRLITRYLEKNPF